MVRMLVLLSGAALIASPALSQTAAPAAAPAQATTAPTPAKVVAGAKVVDTAGAEVGTIESVAGGNAVLATGTTKVSVATGSFAQGPDALVFGLTRAELEAKAAQASAAPVEIAVGAVVTDQSGAKVGTVKEVAADGVTVDSGTAVAKLAKGSFAKGPAGLVIAMSPSQFEEAAKAAGGAKPASSPS